MGWPLAIAAFVATMAGSEIARREHQKTLDRKQKQAVFGIEERRRKADRELPPLFEQAAEDVSTEREKELFNAEDVKNLATIKQTKARMTPDLTRGLKTGGKQSGRFTKLRSDRFGRARERSDLADQAFSRFLSPGRVSQIRGQAPIDVAFGRAKTGDEIQAQKFINDMRIAEIQPNSGTLAFADALRIIGFMGSMYNMGTSLGAEAGTQAAAETTLQAGADGTVSVVPASADLTSIGFSPYTGLSAVPDTSWLGSLGDTASSFGDWAGNLFTPSSSVLPTEAANTQSFIPFSRGASNRFGVGPVMSGMREPSTSWWGTGKVPWAL